MPDDVKRRDFLAACVGAGGIAAGGVSSSAAFQAINDDDSVVSSKPWWVSQVDEPVLGINDDVYARFNQHKNVLNAYRDYVTEERAQEVEEMKAAMRADVEAGTLPGYRREDNALMLAGWTLRGTGNMNRGLRSWAPQRRGGPATPWETTPEHAANVVKRAARFFGAADTGIAPLDRRHIFSRSYGVDIHFEEVDEAYEIEGEKAVIPEKVKYAIAVVVRMSPDVAAVAPSQLCDATTSLGYSRLEFTVGHLGAFIRNLGYTAIPSVNGLGSSPAFAVDAGLGEMGRTNRFISPTFGPAVQLGKVLTDMPMAVDKQIHFGLKEFCTVCGRCAETCPSEALSFDEQPGFEVRGEWNNPGHQAWQEDCVKCFEFWEESNSYCSTCIMVCPWAKKDKTALHEVIKASSAKMPILDRLLVSMDERFGYGKMKDPDAWWDLDLQEHGVDSW